jgi:hypothetical protein
MKASSYDQVHTDFISSQLILHEAHASKNTELSAHFNDTHRIHEANIVLAAARGDMTELVHIKPVHICIKETSPFISTLIYHCGSANLRLYQKLGTQESLDQWILSKKTWREFDLRWKACGKLINVFNCLKLILFRSVSEDSRSTRDVNILVIRIKPAIA